MEAGKEVAKVGDRAGSESRKPTYYAAIDVPVGPPFPLGGVRPSQFVFQEGRLGYTGSSLTFCGRRYQTGYAGLMETLGYKQVRVFFPIRGHRKQSKELQKGQ